MQAQAVVQTQTQVQVRPEGFTTLSDGGERPEIDIVFIHGLGGHPELTWTSTEADVEGTQTLTTTGGAPSPAGAKHLSKGIFSTKRSKQSKEQGKATFFWPRAQLAKDFPQARILTYGYDCSPIKLFGAADKRGIIDHGEDLLSALADNRRDAIERPMIFVVHSLGGIILKRALWTSRDSSRNDRKMVFEHTLGILFYGTPHRGGKYTNIAGALAHAVRASGHSISTRIINNLRQDSEVLELLRKEFWRMLDEDCFDIHSFYETKGLSFHLTMSSKVVDKTSATLEHKRETARSAVGNHMDMCKFTGPEDTRYEAVKFIVKDYLQSEHVRRTEEISNCVASLEVAEMNNDRIESRISTIVGRHERTLDWLFQDSVTRPDGKESRHGFMSWVQGENGIFWIRGKPASGKSTAMKYIHYRMKEFHRKEGSWIHIAVFFHDRGTSEQKTMLGMLRSILKQLILGCPSLEKSETAELIRLIAPCGRISPSDYQVIDNKRRGMDGWLWTVESLQNAIRAVATQKKIKKNVFLMVDALDEHNGDHEEMVRFLQDLAVPSEPRALKFQILLASRPGAPFNDLLLVYPHLSIHKWTGEDVKAFITSSFEEDPTFQRCLQHFHDRGDFPKLKAAVVDRAQGVFLWVRLIIEHVLDQVKGRKIADLSALSKELAKLPDGLADLYTRILTHVPASDSIETYILLETVLRAKQPLTVLELAYVLDLGLDKVRHKLDERESLESRLKIRKNAWSYVDRILGSCKGLLQVYGRTSESPWLDENESIRSAHPFERPILPFQTQTDEAEAHEQSLEGTIVRNLTRRGTTDTTFSEGIALPQRDSLIYDDTFAEGQWHVQLLHQSVKEYLLEGNGRNLDYLFEQVGSSETSRGSAECRVRPADNGHVYILDLCVQLLQLPASFKDNDLPARSRDEAQAIKCVVPPERIVQLVLYHGVYAETTMCRSFMSTLDATDHHLEVALGRKDWPAQFKHHYGGDDWNFNFFAYAVQANMYRFVEDKLRQKPNPLTERKGPPLLFLALSNRIRINTLEAHTGLEMVQLLLDHGAKAQEQWKDYRHDKHGVLGAIRLSHCCIASGYPYKEIILLLLEKGADPNLPTAYRPNREPRTYLVHHVITWGFNAGAKMEILRALKKAGADFTVEDLNRRTMLDVYCQKLLQREIRHEFSITDLEWMLGAGARITAGMFNSEGFERTLLYHEDLRRVEYYTREGKKAARKHNPQWAEPSLLQRFLNKSTLSFNSC